MYLEQIGIGVLVAINCFSFFVVARDKAKSMRGGATERTPEGLIFFLATLFGSVGVYTAMVVFRHKTRKWYFQIGIPALILQNSATLYVFTNFFL